MKIEELIDLLRADNFFLQVRKDHETKELINNLAKDHAGWKFFNKLLRNDYTPDHIFEICLKLDIQTDTELYEWMDNHIKTSLILDIIDPPLELEGTINVDYQTIVDFILKNTQQKNSFKIGEQKDIEYQIIYESDIHYIMKQCPVDFYTYQKEVLDCDDFALMTKAWFAQKGYGNLVIPYVTFDVYTDDKFQYAHAVNMIIYQDKMGIIDGVIWEPQNDKTWKLNEKYKKSILEYDIKLRYLWV